MRRESHFDGKMPLICHQFVISTYLYLGNAIKHLRLDPGTNRLQLVRFLKTTTSKGLNHRLDLHANMCAASRLMACGLLGGVSILAGFDHDPFIFHHVPCFCFRSCLRHLGRVRDFKDV